jgi:hypothetical protein
MVLDDSLPFPQEMTYSTATKRSISWRFFECCLSSLPWSSKLSHPFRFSGYSSVYIAHLSNNVQHVAPISFLISEVPNLCLGNNIFSCFSYFGSPSGVFENSESLYYFRIDGNKNILWPSRTQYNEELMTAYGKYDLRSAPLFVSVNSHHHFYFRTRKLN